MCDGVKQKSYNETIREQPQTPEQTGFISANDDASNNALKQVLV